MCKTFFFFFFKFAQAEGRTWDLLVFCLFSLSIAAPLTTRLLRPKSKSLEEIFLYLKNDWLKLTVNLFVGLHDRQDRFQRVQDAHGRDGLLVALLGRRQDLEDRANPNGGNLLRKICQERSGKSKSCINRRTIGNNIKLVLPNILSVRSSPLTTDKNGVS